MPRSLRPPSQIVDGPGVLPAGNIEVAGARAERRRIPVGRAQHRRIDLAAFFRGDLAGNPHGPALFVEPAQPVHLHERLALQELPGGAIQRVHDAVAIGPQHHLARTALPLDIGQHRNLRGVPVHVVVRRELVIPLELSRVRVERHHRAGVQIVARAPVRIMRLARIPDPPERQVRVRIVGAHVPHRAAAGLPAIVRRPGFVPRLARRPGIV